MKEVFYSAIRSNELQLLDSLLRAGDVILAKKDDVLAYALTNGSLGAVKMVIEAGANINYKDGALAIRSCSNSDESVFRYLLSDHSEHISIRGFQNAVELYALKGNHRQVGAALESKIKNKIDWSEISVEAIANDDRNILGLILESKRFSNEQQEELRFAAIDYSRIDCIKIMMSNGILFKPDEITNSSASVRSFFDSLMLKRDCSLGDSKPANNGPLL